MQLDLGFLLLAFAGIGVAVLAAIVAGVMTARIFFDASRDADRPKEPGRQRAR